MSKRSIHKALGFLIAFTAVLALGPSAFAKSKGAEFEAALVRCVDVNKPALLLGCGSDPLTKGKVEINTKGDVEVVVVGGATSTTYDVVYRSINAATEIPVGTLTTDAAGNGKLQQKEFFALKDVGSGNIVLKQGGSDQFVSGIKVTGLDDESEFEAGLVRCAEVNKSAALPSCGTDKLGEGKAEIDGEDGKIEVKVAKAEPGVSYEVAYRSIDGATELFIGTLTTDGSGEGKLEVEGLLVLADVASGNIVLKRLGLDQFVSGFRVTEKPKPAAAEKATVKSSLIRCIESNQPPLSNCGTDSLFKGFAEINEKGEVKIVLVGAEPKTEYQVFFRLADGSADIDAGMSVMTNPAGNSDKKQDIFDLGTTGSGNVVIKRGGFDQFLTGFKVVK